MNSILTNYNLPTLSDEEIEQDLARNDLSIELKALLTQELGRRRMVEVKNAVEKLNRGSDALVRLTRWLIIFTVILAIPILLNFGLWLFDFLRH